MHHDDNEPNAASNKDKAEGSRDANNEDAGGITNRPLEEEQRNQEELPPRGEAKPGAHAS